MELETNRLILRKFRENDINEAAEYLKDIEVMKYIEKPFTNKETKDFIRKYGINNTPLIYALYEKNERKVIGHIIFHSFDSSDTYELGWIIGREYWGKGYCIEISKAVIEYGFNKMNLKKIIAETVKENKNSVALIKKLGLIEEKCVNKDYNDELIVFSIKRPYEN